MKKIFCHLGFFIIAILTLGIIGVSLYCASDAAIPIYINTPDELANIENTGLDKYYIIQRDLSLKNWVPIGSEDNPFTGTIECVNTIYISSFDNETDKPVGIFSVNKGTISLNSVIVSASNSFSSTNTFGVIAGINFGKIKNVHLSDMTMNVSFLNDRNSIAGAICGINYGTIQKCSSYTRLNIKKCDAEVTLGGICGQLESGTISLLYCSTYFNTVVADKAIVGSVAGKMHGGEINNCYIGGQSIFQDTTEVFCGSLVGECDITDKGLISSCYCGNGIFSEKESQKYAFSTAVALYNGSNLLLDGILSDARIAYDCGIRDDAVNGLFFAEEGRENALTRCFYLRKPDLRDLFVYGTETELSSLNTKMMGWSNKVWSITEEGVKFSGYQE